MTSVLGKWVLDSKKGIEDFLRSLKFEEKFVQESQALNNNKVVTEYILDKDKMTEVVYSDNVEIVRHGFSLGQKRELNLYGQTTDLTTTYDNNKLITKQDLTNGYAATYVTVADGDKLTETMTSYDPDGTELAKAYRWSKKPE